MYRRRKYRSSIKYETERGPVLITKKKNNNNSIDNEPSEFKISFNRGHSTVEL